MPRVNVWNFVPTTFRSVSISSCFSRRELNKESLIGHQPITTSLKNHEKNHFRTYENERETLEGSGQGALTYFNNAIPSFDQ